MHDPWSNLANVLLTEGVRAQLVKNLADISVKVIFSDGDDEYDIVGSYVEDNSVVLVIDAKTADHIDDDAENYDEDFKDAYGDEA